MKRIQRKRSKGWRMPPDTVYVGRPTRWANPFKIGLDGDRETVVKKFREYALERLKREPNWLEPLRGKDLACWCPLDKPCHADILIELLDASEKMSGAEIEISPLCLQKLVTREEIELMRRLREKGLSIPKIARLIKRSPSTVSYYLRHNLDEGQMSRRERSALESM